MKLPFGPLAQLTYCTNVHPGESWPETFANIQTHTERIRALVAPGAPFGIGLRLSDAASIDLAHPNALAAFKEYLAKKNLYVFTLNGFPFGRFHATKVKELVYAPDWTHPERVAYTDRLSGILAELLPDGMEGSISTSPGTFKEWISGEGRLDLIAGNFALSAARLHAIRERTGKTIILAPEPEPLCMMETMGEAAEFFERRLRVAGARKLASLGFSSAESRAILDRHVGVCYDACHMAVEFEGAEESLRHLERAGVRVGKYQISSALRLSSDASALDELRRFADAVYFHQVIGRMPGGEIRRWKDIAPALADPQALALAEELRVHCHVPLFMTEHRGLRSTSGHIDDLLAALARRGAPAAHLEIETYTWDVLPNDLKQDTLDEAVAKEFRWLLDRMQAVERPLRA